MLKTKYWGRKCETFLYWIIEEHYVPSLLVDLILSSPLLLVNILTFLPSSGVNATYLTFRGKLKAKPVIMINCPSLDHDLA